MHGGVKLTLPRDFEGLLTVKRLHGSVSELPPHVATLSEVDGVMKCFVGDISRLCTCGLLNAPGH